MGGECDTRPGTGRGDMASSGRGIIKRRLEALLGGQDEGGGGQWHREERGESLPTGVTWDMPGVSPQVARGRSPSLTHGSIWT